MSHFTKIEKSSLTKLTWRNYTIHGRNTTLPRGLDVWINRAAPSAPNALQWTRRTLLKHSEDPHKYILTLFEFFYLIVHYWWVNPRQWGVRRFRTNFQFHDFCANIFARLLEVVNFDADTCVSRLHYLMQMFKSGIFKANKSGILLLTFRQYFTY